MVIIRLLSIEQTLKNFMDLEVVLMELLTINAFCMILVASFMQIIMLPKSEVTLFF